MAEFLHMGGYAHYVWPAYGLTALVLAWNAWSALRLRRAQLAAARLRAPAASGGDPR
jgi:heme exporter protein D